MENVQARSLSISLRMEKKWVTLKVKADKDGSWTYSFKDLQKYKDGKRLSIRYLRKRLRGYTSQLEELTLAIPQLQNNWRKQDLEGWQPWRPSSQITVNLLANGKKWIDATVNLITKRWWTYRFQNLPKYKDDEITYTISEEKVRWSGARETKTKTRCA